MALRERGHGDVTLGVTHSYVLQRVAVCSSVLQRVAVWQCLAACFGVL